MQPVSNVPAEALALDLGAESVAALEAGAGALKDLVRRRVAPLAHLGHLLRRLADTS